MYVYIYIDCINRGNRCEVPEITSHTRAPMVLTSEVLERFTTLGFKPVVCLELYLGLIGFPASEVYFPVVLQFKEGCSK